MAMIVPTTALRHEMQRRFAANDDSVVVVQNKAQAKLLVSTLHNDRARFHRVTKLMIVDVEAMADDDFVDAMAACASLTHVAFDEALLYIQWSDFRPLMLRSLKVGGNSKKLLMLSATLPWRSRNAIARLLGIRQSCVVMTTGTCNAFVNRINRVRFVAREVQKQRLVNEIFNFLDVSDTAAVVYLPTIAMTETVYVRLHSRMSNRVDVILWHGQLVK